MKGWADALVNLT